MSDSATKEIKKTTEQKFVELAKSTEPEKWSSIQYLQALSASLQDSDKALAKRVLVRVSNLKKKQENKSEPQSKVRQENEAIIETERKSSDKEQSNSSKISSLKEKAKEKGRAQLKSYLFWFVVLPMTVFSIYQLLIASPRYESRAQLIVQQPDGMATMDASMALLSGFGMSVPGGSDAELVKAYIHSKDMLDYLVETLNIGEHFTQLDIDTFSRLNQDYSQEELYDFYRHMVSAEIDEKSSVISVIAQGFSPDYAHKLTQSISQRAEWYINKIGNNLAESQLKFIRGEHVRVEEKLLHAKQQLLYFQDKHNLLDPEAEGLAIQQIAYTLEAQLAEKRSALRAMTAVMSDNAPQVVALKNEIQAIETQLVKERSRLSNNQNFLNENQGITGLENLSVGAILSKYAELKVGMELALQAFTSSQISLEKARIEAYRKLKYLVVVESPTLPEDNKYPNQTYNISLFMLLNVMVFFIVRLVILTVKEVKK